MLILAFRVILIPYLIAATSAFKEFQMLGMSLYFSTFVANMSVPVTILNVTFMGAFRSDAYIGLSRHPNTILDCSHWCLLGVLDAWNELVFSHLLTNGEFLI